MSDHDAAVNEEVVADATAAESATVETEKSEEVEEITDGYDNDVEQKDASTEEESADESTDEAAAEDTEESAQGEPDEKPLAPKSQNRFQQLANENRQLREQLANLDAKQAQVATEQELLNEINPETGDYYTIAEAERAARLQANETVQQQLARERSALEVQQNQHVLTTEANQALQEFPELDSDSDQFDAELAAEYDAALGQAIILNEQGIPIGAHMSPYQLAKSIVGPAKRAAAKAEIIGQANAQKATERMLASADSRSSASGHTPKGKVDPILEGFDSY